MTLILIGIAWLVGLIPVAAWGAPWWMGAAWIVAATPLAVASRALRGRRLVAGACIAAAVVAGYRLEAATDSSLPDWTTKLGEEVTVSGVVTSEPDRNQITTGYEIELQSIGGKPVDRGSVLAQLHQYDRYHPGDRLTVRGKVEPPAALDSFDYRSYLASQGIHATMFRPVVVDISKGEGSPKRWLTELRLDLDESLQRSLPEPEASLAAGIAFGRDDGLSAEAKDEYNRSGLRHLIAVSGANVALVASLAYFFAIPVFGRRWAWLPAAITIAAYLGAAGLSGSVLRAGIMAGVLLGGAAIGRPQAGLPALFAAVMVMTAVEPALVFDAGFQLSATATAGLITFAPWVAAWLMAATARLRWIAVPRLACQVTALTLAATVSTAPIVWATFGRLSLVSPVSNLVVEPVVVLAFWLSVATAVAGLISPDLAEFVALAAYYPLAFIGWASGWFGGLHAASVRVPDVGTSIALAATTALAALALLAYRYPPPLIDEPARLQGRRTRAWRLVLAGGTGAAALAVIPISFASPGASGGLTVQFLDVGQGDAALLTTPDGHQVLIDGGPSGIELARELGAAMPHWDRSLDAVILTHPQEDHLGGLPEIARRYQIATNYDTAIPNTTASYGLYRQTIQHRTVLTRGDRFEVDGVAFEALWPPAGFESQNLNDASLVLRVSYGAVTFLFTGDAENTALNQLPAAQLHADVLKVPHHGSKTTPPAFFDSVGQAIAVISVGAENIFGHPHPDTMAALDGTRVVRTDERGRITIRTDGTTLRLKTER